MRQNYDAIFCQMDIRFYSMSSNLDSALERRHGVLGECSSISSMCDSLWSRSLWGVYGRYERPILSLQRLSFATQSEGNWGVLTIHLFS